MSITLKQAAQQAIECLESLQGGCTDSDDGTVEAITVWCPEVIEALRTAIQQAEVQQPPSKEHLFELWWEAHMPNATQEQAWTAFTAAVASNGVGIAAQQPATPEPVGYLYDFKYDDEIAKNWFTQNIDEIHFRPANCLNIRPLYAHPAPGVPDDVVRDAISTVREQYRGTDLGKAAEGICDAIDAAMLAVPPAQKGGE